MLSHGPMAPVQEHFLPGQQKVPAVPSPASAWGFVTHAHTTEAFHIIFHPRVFNRSGRRWNRGLLRAKCVLCPERNLNHEPSLIKQRFMRSLQHSPEDRQENEGSPRSGVAPFSSRVGPALLPGSWPSFLHTPPNPVRRVAGGARQPRSANGECHTFPHVRSHN